MYELAFRYDPDVNTVIKSLPRSAWEWRPASKRWVIDCIWLDELRNRLRDIGYILEGSTTVRPPPSVASLPKWAPDWSTMFYARLRNAGADIDAVHAVLRPVLAPDLQTELDDGLEAARWRRINNDTG